LIQFLKDININNKDNIQIQFIPKLNKKKYYSCSIEVYNFAKIDDLGFAIL
jgi:hypothetical protein